MFFNLLNSLCLLLMNFNFVFWFSHRDSFSSLFVIRLYLYFSWTFLLSLVNMYSFRSMLIESFFYFGSCKIIESFYIWKNVSLFLTLFSLYLSYFIHHTLNTPFLLSVPKRSASINKERRYYTIIRERCKGNQLLNTWSKKTALLT